FLLSPVRVPPLVVLLLLLAFVVRRRALLPWQTQPRAPRAVDRTPLLWLDAPLVAIGSSPRLPDVELVDARHVPRAPPSWLPPRRLQSTRAPLLQWPLQRGGAQQTYAPDSRRYRVGQGQAARTSVGRGPRRTVQRIDISGLVPFVAPSGRCCRAHRPGGGPTSQ